MENIKKFKKLFIALIFIVSILIGTKAQAYEHSFSPKTTSVTEEEPYFHPYSADNSNYWYYCIRRHEAYRVSDPLPTDYDTNKIYNEWCPGCMDAKKNPPTVTQNPDGSTGGWTTGYTMTYDWTSTIDARYYQDAAYVMASTEDKGAMDTQWSLWTTTLNANKQDPNDPTGNWGNAAASYKSFYDSIHNGTIDTYHETIHDNTDINNVVVAVNHDEKEYMVGPFKISYLQNSSNGELWSYITNITLLNQEGNAIGNVNQNTIHITDASGSELTHPQSKKNFPESDKEFYVKFSSTLGDINQMHLKVDFEYLESCSASLQQYEGRMTVWKWKVVDAGKCEHGHQMKGYKLFTIKEKTPQVLMAFYAIEHDERREGRASKNYKPDSIIVAPGGIDLTMKISGKVFLDMDKEKPNTGNDKMDGDNEALPDVEVVLYDAATNQVVTKTNKTSQYHIHDSGCYELKPSTILVPNPDHPYHTGDCDHGGPGTCFETPATHVHTGDPITGGGCYTTPIYHVHTDACYGEETHEHTHEGNLESMGPRTVEVKDCKFLRAYNTTDPNGSGYIGNYGWYNATTRQFVIEKQGDHPNGPNGGGGLFLYFDGGSYYKLEDITLDENSQLYSDLKESCKKTYYPTKKGCYHQHTEACDIYELCLKDIECYQYGRHAWSGASADGFRFGWKFDKDVDMNNYEDHKRLICDLDESTSVCGQTTERKLICGKVEGEIEGYELGCGLDENKAYGWALSCTIPIMIKQTTEVKVLKCNKSNQIENTVNEELKNPVITDKNGYYEFDGLDPMKTYYVKFVYNGILYTNVEAIDPFNEGKVEEGQKALPNIYCGKDKNGKDIYYQVKPNDPNVSKADEASSANYEKNNGRNTLNSQFEEIGSYPSNYKIVNKVFGNELGDYNKVYLQEDIADIFKMISAKMENAHTDNYTGAAQAVYNELEKEYRQEEKIELKRKIQFAADCRVPSYTLKTYPLAKHFIIGDTEKDIGGTLYAGIYSENYDTKDLDTNKHVHGLHNQLHVNLGIKALETFDLSLYKDVLKAEVSINGKTETYNYDSRKQSSPFKVGIDESNYLENIQKAYKTDIFDEMAKKDFDRATQMIRDKRSHDIDSDYYNLAMRTEEIANGNSLAYNSNVTGKVDGKYQVNENYNLTGDDRLKIKVTYKIAIINESSTLGTITELVDYYDTNYRFVDAYVGDVNGHRTGAVTKYDSSMYADSEYKSTKNAYNTIYLRPDNETRLSNAGEQYIYVVLELVGPDGDAGTLLTEKLLKNNSTLNTMNLVEINGYKTYNNTTRTDGGPTNARGLIDKDSIPGNLNISNIDALTQNNIVNYPHEDDTNRAPALIYKTTNSKTIEGTVFEDSTGKTNVVTGEERSGNGILDKGETGIHGVIVELIEIKYNNEIKNNEMIVRATTTTHNKDGRDGWYGFTGFIPGDYVIRYTYGADNDTALSNSSVFEKGLNDKSYNGQDYQSTTYTVKGDTTQVTPKTDSNLIQRYTDNHNAKNSEESTVKVTGTMIIDKNNNYWYTVADAKSDAKDYAYRVNQVIDYSKKEYGTEITNHKAEVFNSYMNPQPDHINTADANSKLVNELERRTYRYAYTPVIEVEVEYAKRETTGNKEESHEIKGVDFGIVERPKSELTIDQDVKHIKVTLADGRVLFDTETGTDNLQWINKGNIDAYDKSELVNVIMDEELINGATIEITYNITVKNNSEADTGTTRAKNIVNYVANNLNFDVEDNKDTSGNALWKVVSKDSVQYDKNSTFVNNKAVDLSTQSVILQATEDNPLTRKDLKPKEQVTTELKLKKVLSTESSTDDLTYTNMTEIVEIDNTIGRYDHEATPGNQKLELQPREHDTSGASKYTSFDSIGQPDEKYPPDGVIIVTPPTGSNYIYYVIGITGALILAVGIFLIKKFVIDKKK